MTGRILLYATMNWPSAARYAGGFVAAGNEVHAACPKDALVRLSRYVTRTYRYRALAPLFSLKRAVSKSKPDLIVACDDRAVAHLLNLYRTEARKPASPVAALIARSLGRPENYGRVVSRSGSLSELQAMGVRVPDTRPVTSERDLEDGIAAAGLPVVLKSDGSWGGEGVMIAHSREESQAAYRKLSRLPSRLRSLARALRRRDAHFLLAALKPAASPVSLQKFVAGRPAASAFAAHKGKIVAAFHYDVLVAEGTIGPPNIIRRVDDAEMDATVRAVAACFGLSGLHGLDYIRDEAGAAHLIEVNPRATQGGTLPFGMGRDLPAALAQTLTLEPVGLRPAIGNDLVAFFPRAMRRDPAGPYLSASHHDIPKDDPKVLRALLDGEKPRRNKFRVRMPRLGALRPVAGR